MIANKNKNVLQIRHNPTSKQFIPLSSKFYWDVLNVKSYKEVATDDL